MATPTTGIVVDDAEVQAALRAAALATGDLGPPLAAARMLMLREVHGNLKGGVKPPLSESYYQGLVHPASKRNAKGKLTKGRKTSRSRSQALETVGYRQAISSESDDRRAVVGSSHPYVQVHEMGASFRVPEIRPTKAKALRWVSASGAQIFSRKARAHDVTIPARPIFAMSPTTISKIALQFWKHAERGIKRGISGIQRAGRMLR